MPALNRASLIAKTHKVLKQHYDVHKPEKDYPLLEQLLFACCLENAPFALAEKVYHRLTSNFFDWNEVRVSTVNELAEVMKDLPEPSVAASNLKKVLQGVFESTYSFDLEPLKKQNISQGIKRLQSIEGVTPFVQAFAVQRGLDGHSIPLDRGALEVLMILGIATPPEAAAGQVTGLERAIPKNKGVEFGDLLHQLGADYVATPHSPNVKKIFTAINPQAVIPKRTAKHEPSASSDAAASQSKSGKGKVSAKSAPPDEKPAAQPTKNTEKGAAKPAEKPAAKSAKPEKRGTPAAKQSPARAPASAKRKSPSKQLAKRKPR
jgi:endonuclease-3